MRPHVRGLFLYPPPRGGRACEKSRRVSVSEQINNRFNESRIDKPGTRHGYDVYIRRRTKRKRRYLTCLETLKQCCGILFEKSSIAPQTRYRIATWVLQLHLQNPGIMAWTELLLLNYYWIFMHVRIFDHKFCYFNNNQFRENY